MASAAFKLDSLARWCLAGPALKAGTSEVYTILKNATGKASAGSRQNLLRSVLVTAEVALAVVLLTGTGLMIKGVVDGMRKGLGFAQDHVLTAFVSLPDSHYSDAGKQAVFYRALVTKMENLPGTESAAVASVLPAGGADQISFRRARKSATLRKIRADICNQIFPRGQNC
jgi:hypothetical protein